jgi:hypothetical protein
MNVYIMNFKGNYQLIIKRSYEKEKQKNTLIDTKYS